MRWIRRLLIACIVLVIVGFAVEMFVLPIIVHRQVLAALRRIDPVASARLLDVSPWRLRLGEITLGEAPWLSVAVAEATFNPLDILLRGRADHVRVEGAHWHVRVRDGGIDFGFDASTDRVDPGDTGVDPADLLDRFRRFDLPGAVVRIEHEDGRTTLVSADAALVTEDARTRRLTLRTDSVNIAATERLPALDNATMSVDAVIDRNLQPGVTTAMVHADRVAMAGTTLHGVDITLAIDESGGRLTLPRGVASASPWHASAPVDLHVRAETLTTAISALGATGVKDVAADLDLSLAVDADGLTLHATTPATITLARLRTDNVVFGNDGADDDDGGRETTITATIEAASPDRPLLTVSGDVAESASKWRIRVADAVSFDRPDATGSFTGVEASGEAFLGTDRRPIVDALLTIADGSARLPKADLTLEEIHTQCPVTIGIDDTRDGTFTITRATRGGRALGRAAGRLAVRDGRLDVNAGIDLAGGAHANASGHLGFVGEAFTGAAHVEAPPFTITDTATFARMLGLERGAKIGGTWSLAADLASTGATTVSTLRVDLLDASLTLPALDLEMTAITGHVSLSDLTSLRTPNAQRVTVGAGRIGKVPFRDAAVEFRLDDPRVVHVVAAEVVLADGARLRATPFRFDPAASDITTTIDIENMSLAYWLPIATGGRASGSGTLSGRVPVTYRPHAARRFEVGEGFLHAGTGGGWIRTAEVAQLAALLDQSDARFRTDERMRVVKDQLIDALRDYAYDTLTFDVMPERDGLMLRAFTKGRGRRGSPPQEIGGLTVNLHDIDGILSRVLSVRRALEHQSDRALERFFDE